MPHNPGDIADSPLASEPADLDALDSDLDRAAEFLAEIARASPLPKPPEFERLAVAIFSAPFAAALQVAASADATTGRTEFVAALLGEVNAAKDPYMALRCLPIIFDLPTGGESEQDIADAFGVGRAAVSALCVDLRERLRVPPGRGMRDDATREKYAARQRGRRAKPLASPWPFAGLMARVKSSLHP